MSNRPFLSSAGLIPSTPAPIPHPVGLVYTASSVAPAIVNPPAVVPQQAVPQPVFVQQAVHQPVIVQQVIGRPMISQPMIGHPVNGQQVIYRQPVINQHGQLLGLMHFTN